MSSAKLNNYVFYNCSNLKTVKLPDNLTLIGDYVFCGCYNLQYVNIPASVTSIGTDAFDLGYSWRSDTRDVYITDLSAWCKLNFDEPESKPLKCGANLYLNNTLVKELQIPSDITTINKNQFYNCESITAVKIHSNVEKIEENAFYSCKNIEYVEIPKDLFYIRNNAFYGCDNLAEVHYGGTESEWNEIIIVDGNEALSNAYLMAICYIELIDNLGKTNSITCLPSSRINFSDIEKMYMHKVTLYTDEAMTKEFDLQTPINDNITLYVKIAEEKENNLQFDFSPDGKSIIVNLINIDKGNVIILVLYKNGKAVKTQVAKCTGENVTFSADYDYTDAKVMVWESFSNLKPKYRSEIIK